MSSAKQYHFLCNRVNSAVFRLLKARYRLYKYFYNITPRFRYACMFLLTTYSFAALFSLLSTKSGKKGLT